MRTKLTVIESYRVDTESEAKDTIEEFKDNAVGGGYELVSYSSTKKEKKSKGEVIDEGFEVKITKQYNKFWMDGAF